jgi:hypothetical protein
MSYSQFITVRLTAELFHELNRHAARSQTDVGKLVRRLIVAELYGKRDRISEAIDQILYLAIAMDGLLATNPNPDLRNDMLRLWQDRLAEEGRSDAA